MSVQLSCPRLPGLRFGVLMATAALILPLAAQAAEAPASVAPGADPAAPAAAVVEPAAPTAATDVAADTIPSTEQLMIGDRLQVSFFEQLNLGQGVDAGMNGDVRTFYQRLDLTGEHVVDADGAIAFPLIGRFSVSGMTAEEAQSKITEAYQQVTGRAGEVHIAVMERLPIFVTGIVRTPGSFQFRPGMILMQAIALAGGYDRDQQAAARYINAERERERHAQATDSLERLLAKRVRLLQERDMLDNPGQAMQEDHGAAQSGEGDGAMAGEMELLASEIDARRSEAGVYDARVASAEKELEAMRNMLVLVEKQIEVRSERLRVLQQMKGSGLSTLEPLWNAQKDVADFEMQRERVSEEIVTAEQKVAEVKAARVKFDSDQRLANQRELAAVAEQIAQQETVVKASAEITAAIETDMMDVDRGTASIRLLVLRHDGEGTITLPADVTTRLVPGDVVTVDVVPSDKPAQTGAL